MLPTDHTSNETCLEPSGVELVSHGVYTVVHTRRTKLEYLVVIVVASHAAISRMSRQPWLKSVDNPSGMFEQPIHKYMNGLDVDVILLSAGF